MTDDARPTSDPGLLDAYRKQLAAMDPGLVYLASGRVNRASRRTIY